MSRLIGLVVIVLIVVGAIGYYQGWLGVVRTDSGGATSVSVTVDKDKIKENEEKAVKQIQDAGRKVKEQIGGTPSTAGR